MLEAAKEESTNYPSAIFYFSLQSNSMYVYYYSPEFLPDPEYNNAYIFPFSLHCDCVGAPLPGALDPGQWPCHRGFQAQEETYSGMVWPACACF